jgi:hypothetical protein
MLLILLGQLLKRPTHSTRMRELLPNGSLATEGTTHLLSDLPDIAICVKLLADSAFFAEDTGSAACFFCSGC